MYYIIAYWSCVLGIPLSVEGRRKFKIAAGMLYSRECEWTLGCGPLERNICYLYTHHCESSKSLEGDRGKG